MFFEFPSIQLLDRSQFLTQGRNTLVKLSTKIQDDRMVEENVIRIAVTGQMQFSGAKSSVLFLKFPAIQPLDRALIFSGGSRHIEETLIQNSERSDGPNKSYSHRTNWADVVHTKS